RFGGSGRERHVPLLARWPTSRSCADVQSPRMEIHEVTAAVGAEVSGVDLSSELDDVTIAALRLALNRHHVLFFHGQRLSPRQQLAFAERFGPVQLPMIDSPATDVPGVTVLDQVGPKGQGTDRWHADSTFMAQPPLGAILHAGQDPRVGRRTCV